MKYFYGYNIVAAGFVIQGISVGVMFAYGVFFKELQAEFGWTRAMISGASSLIFLLMGAVAILAGKLNDRIGPRIILVAAGISLGIAYLLLSRLQAPWQLYLMFAVPLGIGLSPHDVTTLSTVARWFKKRRGMMTGIVKVGTGSGQLLMPLIATALIAFLGWRNSAFFLGAGTLVAIVAVAQMMRRDPQGMGLLPDGADKSTGGEAANSEEHGLSLKEAAAMVPFWIICFAEFTVFFCLLTMVVHIVPYARDTGMSPAIAAGVLSTIGGVSMLGRFVLGTAIDIIGGKRSLIICFIVLLGRLFWLQVAGEGWLLFVFAGIWGIAHGGFFTVVSPTVAELFGTRSHGLLFGIVLFSGTLGGAFGPLIAGYAFDVAGNYRTVFLALTVLASLGFILTILLLPPRDSSLSLQ